MTAPIERKELSILKRFGLVLCALAALTGVANAEVQPLPPVGSQIIVTGTGTSCFDNLDNLKLSEVNLTKWSSDKMDAFFVAHEIGFNGDEKAKVLAVKPTYIWENAYGTDHVAPIQLLIESSHQESGHDWKGRTCWWEFSENPDVKIRSWKPQ